jgi:hypothetical protein
LEQRLIKYPLKKREEEEMRPNVYCYVSHFMFQLIKKKVTSTFLAYKKVWMIKSEKKKETK